ncbi:2-dehydro-3-deoxygalactonokinase [Ruegeria jejuensis]|uniref:2-dehydro-3-deoxygalactonokinase n=1 Tax=Ruegeria jejuensis TaxID=3233338 RepID=UPI00355BC166
MTQVKYAIVDWGTSSFRAWALDASGTVLASAKTDQGMLSLKRSEFAPALDRCLTELSVPKSVDVVVCGMAGAKQGWTEAPYVDLPARLDALHLQAARPQDIDRNVWIIPGLAQRDARTPDVMRGEETILLGAQMMRGGDGLFCLPGTHCKWAEMTNGVVTRFETALTGELYALLSTRSTLSSFFDEARPDIAGSPAFSAAVSEALAAPQKILQMLFSTRAHALLFEDDLARAIPARLSGLLIGLEIAGMNQPAKSHVTLITSGQIGEAYRVALDVAGLTSDTLQAEEFVQAGLLHFAKAISTEQAVQTPQSKQRLG